MRDGRLFWIVTVLMVVLSGSVAAQAFDTSLTTIKEDVLPGDAALFRLAIINNLGVTDNYVISSPEYSFILSVDPVPTGVDPGKGVLVSIELSPRSYVNYGTHKVDLKVKSQATGETKDVELLVFVKDPNQGPGIYTPSIALSVGLLEQVDPRNDFTLNVHLRNRNARIYDKDDPVKVIIDSDLFYKEYNTQLGGVGQNGEKTTEVKLELDPFQPPGTHELTVRVIADNKTISTETTSYEIISYEDVQETEFSDTSFFKKQTSYKLQNNGNIRSMKEIMYPISPVQRPFLSASSNYEVVRVDGKMTAIFTVTLEPQEEIELYVTENYRLLILLLVLIVLSVIGYYILRSPLILQKEASLGGSPKEGVHEIKVQLFVKNRSSKTLRNLRVIDRISGVAEIPKDTSLGTLKPTKVVKKQGQGTLLRWDLEQLDPFEERIITYKAKSPLKLVGDVTLPNMKVKYDLPSGRERTAHSNEVTVNR